MMALLSIRITYLYPKHGVGLDGGGLGGGLGGGSAVVWVAA